MKLTTFRRPLFLIVLVLFVVVLGRFYARPVLAQVRATLIQNVDEPGRTPYHDSQLFNQTGSSCPNSYYCVVQFAPVPAGHRLVVTSAGARWQLVPGGVEAYGDLSVNSALSGNTMLLVAPQYIGANYFVSAGPTAFYVEAGQSPSIIMGGNQIALNGYTSEASISGYLVATP